MSVVTDPTEQANRCRNMLFSVIRQAVIDHRANLKTARSRLNAVRKAKRLPCAEDCEVVEFAIAEEPGRWIMSDDIGRMSFRWCCEHVGIDPSWIRLRINRHEFLALMDAHEKKKAA